MNGNKRLKSISNVNIHPLKDINVSTANEFHIWQRDNLPSWLVIQDIDTWILMPANSKKAYEPIAIIEEKRSYKDPEEWEPYEKDKPNYIALYRLSQRARLPLWVLYFKKGEPLKKVALYKVESVNAQPHDWIKYDKRTYTTDQLKNNFESIFGIDEEND